MPALDTLTKRTLVRDDTTDPNGRVYRDLEGNIYHSVTRILQATSANKAVLEAWAARLGEQLATQERDTAAERGTRMHNAGEYLLRTAKKMAERTAHRKGSLYTNAAGLECPSASLTKWALKQVAPSAPSVGFSAAGYRRGLLNWIVENVTAIHAVEFSVHHPIGFAGTADALLSVSGVGPLIVDWKSSFRRRSEELLHDYCVQLGAYSLGLRHLTGIRPVGGIVVVARRVGPPDVRRLSALELRGAEAAFQDRCVDYFDSLALPK